MNTISIIDKAVLNESKLCGYTTVTIPIKSYNYLCSITMKQNLFAHMSDCYIEMDFTYFIDLITSAHMVECNNDVVDSYVEYVAS